MIEEKQKQKQKQKQNGKKARYITAKKQFQDLFVAGILGAFFTALLSNLPFYFNQAVIFSNADDIDLAYTGLVFLKFLYLLWFLCYFYVSHLLNKIDKENPAKLDLFYDVAQSLLAFVAAVSLGYLSPSETIGIENFFWPLVAIMLICIFALFLSLIKEKANGDINIYLIDKTVNRIRLSGFFCSLAVVVLVFCFDFLAYCECQILILFLAIAYLFYLLYQFFILQVIRGDQIA